MAKENKKEPEIEEKPKLNLIEQLLAQNVRFFTFLYFDVFGKKYSLTVPISELDISVFAAGHETETAFGEAKLLPDRDNFFILPWQAENVFFITRVENKKDPFQYLEKAIVLLGEEGLGFAKAQSRVSFNVFDNLSWVLDSKTMASAIESVEMTSMGKNYPLSLGEEKQRAPPHDSTSAFRTQLAFVLKEFAGKEVISHYHGDSFGCCVMEFKETDLINSAISFLMLKFFAKNLSLQMNAIATFMPKPLWESPGNFYELSFTLEKDGKNTFLQEEEMSGLAKKFIGGILAHAPSLCLFTNPSTNSYRRLLEKIYGWSSSFENTILRFRKGRVVFSLPDPSCVPPMAIAATLLAGLDGVKNNTDPGTPLERTIIKRSLPSNLKETASALEDDNSYLGPLFEKDILSEYLRKKKAEYLLVEKYPSPIEYKQYLDI